MRDVFQRLHRLSVSAKTGRSAMAVEAARKSEEEMWKKRLAAECRIVTEDPHEYASGTVAVPCLNISSVQTKPRPQSALVRKVSTVLSRDGSVSSTQYYIVTDSVEPPPYNVARVQTPRRLQVTRSKREGVFETHGMRKEIRNFKKRILFYGTLQRVVVVEERLPEPETTSDANDDSDDSHVIQVDFNNPLCLDKEICPLHMISHTGHQWDSSGYPTSVSYILDLLNVHCCKHFTITEPLFMSEIELAPNNQFAAVIKPGEVFVVASDCYTRIERFSILSDHAPFAGQRVSIMASVDAPTLDGRTVNMNVAVASFIVCRDFDQNCELVISPADKCKLSVLGAPVEMQMLFSKFPGE